MRIKKTAGREAGRFLDQVDQQRCFKLSVRFSNRWLVGSDPRSREEPESCSTGKRTLESGQQVQLLLHHCEWSGRGVELSRQHLHRRLQQDEPCIGCTGHLDHRSLERRNHAPPTAPAFAPQATSAFALRLMMSTKKFSKQSCRGHVMADQVGRHASS